MAFALVVTVTNAYTEGVVADYPVEVYSDEAGTTLLFREYTTTAGTATFSLDAATYYLFGRGVGYSVTNPTESVIAAADTAELEVTPLSVYDGDATSACNGAILLVGSGFEGSSHIDSYENDTGPLADWCRRRYDICRKRALVKHRWNEAIKLLSGEDGAGDDDSVVHPKYDYAYALPAAAGCVALRGIVDEDEKPLLCRRAGQFIHTDYATDEFWWDFVEDIETGFSPGLQQCIEYELAINLTGFLLKGNAADAKRQALQEEYRVLILPDAKGENQQEQYDEHNESADELWTDVT
ncbi:MAG: hypothetical protein V2A79_16400 [Planctomycetota bacterium]